MWLNCTGRKNDLRHYLSGFINAMLHFILSKTQALCFMPCVMVQAIAHSCWSAIKWNIWSGRCASIEVHKNVLCPDHDITLKKSYNQLQLFIPTMRMIVTHILKGQITHNSVYKLRSWLWVSRWIFIRIS